MPLNFSYLFRHQPITSAPISESKKWSLISGNNEVEEKAILLLANGKFAFIRYSGLVNDVRSGLTEVLEFDTLGEALEIYE